MQHGGEQRVHLRESGHLNFRSISRLTGLAGLPCCCKAGLAPKPVAGAPKPVAAGAPKPVAAGAPKPVAAGAPKPVAAGAPKPVAAGAPNVEPNAGGFVPAAEPKPPNPYLPLI